MNSGPKNEAGRRPQQPLRVLHLEDNPADCEIVRHVMNLAGFESEFVHARNQVEFEAALGRVKFELILSDFSLPAYDGFSALALARERQPEAPFLFVSGTIGEATAVDSLKNGATDYVLKEHLERLAPAVRRALREAEERARRKEAENALLAAEQKFRGIFENAQEGIFQSTLEGRYLTVNPALARIYGYESPADLLADMENMRDRLYVDSGRHAEFGRLLAEQGRLLGVESRVRRRDGRVIWISENTRAVRDAGGQLLYFEGTVEDITPRKETSEALRNSEERLREMAETIRDVFWVISLETHGLLYVSPAYEKIWGRPTAGLYSDSGAWFEAILAEDRARVLDALKKMGTGADYRAEYRIRRPDGALRWIEDRGYPVRDSAGKVDRVVGIAADITERRLLEEQLRQAQKMEAVGQLAGGIAHDFSNILTVVNGQLGRLLEEEKMAPEVTEVLKQVYSAGERATALTRQLLVFSRQQAMLKKTIDLNELIDQALQMLRHLIGEHVILEPELDPGLPFILADASMVEQVLLNLVVNARDAMPRGGRLVISTRAVTVTDGDAQSNPGARPGTFVCLGVRDTGTGISAEVMAHIYEPFFTTKEVGKGTGLGLATVFGIVNQHGGWLMVDSKVGAGTLFKVFLPAAETGAVPDRPELDKTKICDGGNETILLVEDDPPVREFATVVLKRRGYRVLQAGSGVEALEVWKWHRQRIALLLTDMVMPDNLTGRELAEKLQAEKTELKVVYTSGYSREMMTQVAALQSEIHFLQKPYQSLALAKIVRAALDTRK